MRDQNWLQEKLKELLEGPFSDLVGHNQIRIRFGRRSKRRLGSIRISRDKRVSTITMSAYFRDESVPEQVVKAVIAHELSHYAHGFCSPLKRLYSHPHRGNVITRELKKRGLHALESYEKIWTKRHWPKVVVD